MTKVQVYKQGDDFTEFAVKGHSGFAEHGTDIVCASVSAITQTAVLGLIRVAKIEPIISKKKGSLEIKISPESLKTKQIEIFVIIQTMVEGIRDLQKQFPKHINLQEVSL